MKKIIFGLTLLILVSFLAILIVSKNKHIEKEETYYTIPRILTYHYEENKKMSFEIFLNDKNSSIEYPQNNEYFLKDKKNTYPLQEVAVNKEKDFIMKDEGFYKYTITCNLLNIQKGDIILENCSLEIKNTTFILEVYIGYLAVYKETYFPLDFTDLYGNYAYINNELHLIGMTLQLNPTYKTIQWAKIGNAFVSLDHLEKDQLYDSERQESSLKHTLISEQIEEKRCPLNAKYNYYFLPISYPKLALITQGCLLLKIDDKIYYIEDFTYLANLISIQSYSNTKEEGKITYA